MAVYLVHKFPSEEVIMVPELPADTKVLFPKVTPLRSFVVPEVLLVHALVTSGDVRMIQFGFTATNVPFP